MTPYTGKQIMAVAWYVLHTYSGRENSVKANLEKRIRVKGIEDKIPQIFVPTREVAEIKGGKRKVSVKTSFPGYVLVRMEMDSELWNFVKNTPDVMGFAGTSTKPIPLKDEEVERVFNIAEHEHEEEPKLEIDLSVGDKAKIISGSGVGFSGVVDEIDEERGKLRLIVTTFGNIPVPLEVDLLRVEKQ